MRSYAIKGVDHIVYDDLTEVPSDIYFLDDWRNAELGDWVLTDDDCVIQILRRGKMLNQGRYKMEYLGTCTGTFIVSGGNIMDTVKRKNIYSFGGSKDHDQVIRKRKNATAQEVAFAKYLVRGLTPEEAYLKSFGNSKSNRYAKARAAVLVKQERIINIVKEELEEVFEGLGINLEYLIHGVKNVADTSDRASDRLSAFRMLWDAADVVPKQKVTQISGAVFQGFDSKVLESAKRPELKGKVDAPK
tara:strand:- start:7 stop:744 length:738 start_codon:yes stop_codon:yes gene_type:complete